MHRVIKQHVTDFGDRFALDLETSKLFEAFAAYCVLRQASADEVDPSSLVYEGADPGIDAILFFVDDFYVSSVEEFEDAIGQGRRDKDVFIVALQSKTSEYWQKADINVFQSALHDFFGGTMNYPSSEYLNERYEIFDAVIRNVGKIRGGKPRITCYFATSAPAPTEAEILGAIGSIRASLMDTGNFAEVNAEPLHRDRLVELWDKVDGGVEATLPVFAIAAFPKTPGVEESYVATTKAKDYVDVLLTDPNGNIRKRVFEENVRDYIGSDAEINAEIMNTLSDAQKQKRFGLLNNGVTIVSPDVRVQGNEIFLRDYQIVNGCQTSNLLFETDDRIGDDVTVMLKIIETSDREIVDEIVRSTNRQTKVQDAQFLATLDCVRAIDRYFRARGSDEEHRLFFERRKHQFASEDVTAIRVFGIPEVARCAGAMFFDRPELAARYPNRLTGELSELVFAEKNKENIYYTACYTWYRMRLHFGNKRIDPRCGKLIWHLLCLIKYRVLGANPAAVSSRKICSQCDAIDKFMADGSERTLGALRDLCALFGPVEAITRDRLKGQSLLHEARKALLGDS